MEEPSEEWKIEEYSPEANGGKVSWILNKGLTLGRKILITGFVVSSTPVVLPPLLAISAIGFAFAIPSGVLLASYACSEMLMSRLLPGTAPPPLLPLFGMAYNDEEKGKEGVVLGGEVDMEKEEEELMEETKRRVEMRIELLDEGIEENNDEVQTITGGKWGQRHSSKDEPELVEDGVVVEQNGYEEDFDESLDEEEKQLEDRIEVKQEPRQENEEHMIKGKWDEQTPEELGVVVVIEEDDDSSNNVEKMETPIEVSTIVLEELGGSERATDIKENELGGKVREVRQKRRQEKEEHMIKGKWDEHTPEEGLGVVVVIEEDDDSSNNVEKMETPIEVSTIVLEELGGLERATDIKENELGGKVREVRQERRQEKEEHMIKVKWDEHTSEKGLGVVVVIEEDDDTINNDEKTKNPIEVSTIVLKELGGPERASNIKENDSGGKVRDVREKKAPKEVENQVSITKYVEPLEETGDVLVGKGVEINLPAEKPIVAVSEMVNEVIVPNEIEPVEEMREGKEADSITEAVREESNHVTHEIVLDFQLKRNKETAFQHCSSVPHETAKESSVGTEASLFVEPASDKEITVPSSEETYNEEKIWEKIDAMRTIVGYRATPQGTCIEELKALYVFTGVQPPTSFKDPGDLGEVYDMLQFLMSIVGVK